MQTYEEFINGILLSRGRFTCGEKYHERHHIIPKSCGGSNDESNLIDLYACEHFEAHKLLALENPDNKKIVYAWWCMCNYHMYGCDDEINAKDYEEAKIRFSTIHSQEMMGENNPMYGKCRPEISGENHYLYGKHLSDEQREKISKARTGKYVGENNPMYGRTWWDENTPQEKINEWRKHKSEAVLFGANNPASRKVVRLSDLKIYDCAKFAAEDNNVCYRTIYNRCKMHIDFMYYDEWLVKPNN